MTARRWLVIRFLANAIVVAVSALNWILGMRHFAVLVGGLIAIAVVNGILALIPAVPRPAEPRANEPEEPGDTRKLRQFRRYGVALLFVGISLGGMSVMHGPIDRVGLCLAVSMVGGASALFLVRPNR